MKLSEMLLAQEIGFHVGDRVRVIDDAPGTVRRVVRIDGAGYICLDDGRGYACGAALVRLP